MTCSSHGDRPRFWKCSYLANGEVANSLNSLNSYTLTGGTLTLTSGQVGVIRGALATIGSNSSAAPGSLMATAGTLILSGPQLAMTGPTNVTFGSIQLGVANSLPITTTLTINSADGNSAKASS